MSAAPAPAPDLAPPPVEPLYLGADDRPWFVQLHRPAPARACGVGLVIVPPFGYEAVCAHRALRHLAERAAAAGVLAVRVDLDGTGDSAGDDCDPDRVARWCASIGAAADLARARGASRVVLAGVRLGATLAAQVAAARTDVAGLVAITPVISGRRWLREMRALQQALGLRPPPPGRATPPDDIHEAIGFALTTETRDALTAIDLDQSAARPAPAVLVLDRNDLPPSAKWIARLRELGAEVDARQLPGYVEMVLDPHRADVPDELLAAAIDFARARPPLEPAPPPAAAPHARAIAHLASGTIVEEPVTIDGVRAIVARPAGGPRPRRALVLLNAGCVRRIGPNRVYVGIARRLAAAGIAVVRVDLSGIGDSPARAGVVENLAFHPRALDDITAVIAWARRHAADEVVLGGLCSGGYYTVRAAVAGQPIAGMIAVNPGHPDTESYASKYEAVVEAGRYAGSMRSLSSWKKVVRGEIDLVRVARLVSRRVVGAVSNRALEVARRVGVPLEGDLGAELIRIAKAGVTPTFVFSAGESVHELFVQRAGSTPRRLEANGQLRIHLIDGPDHTFTARWAHPLLEEEFVRALAWSAA